MKTKLFWAAFVIAAVTQLAAGAETNDVAALVQRGLFEEEANHQLDAAISDYKDAIEHFDHDRKLAATAVFRLGECYRKQGKTNEANAQYERVVREFPDQTQLAQLSQGYLPAPAVAAAGEPATLPSDEADFLRKAIETTQTSPDLLNQRLAAAVGGGYVSAAQYLIAHGADVNHGSPIGEAAKAGNDAMVQLLLSHGAAVNAANWNGSRDTPLLVAVEKGYMTVCRTLVAHGADINAKNSEGFTPLHYAVQRESPSIAEFLITNKADVDAANNKGQTSLSLAITARNSEMVKLLLDNHANANMESYDPWDRQLSPLGRTIYVDQPGLVKRLLAAHADPNHPIQTRPNSDRSDPSRNPQNFGWGDDSGWKEPANPVLGMTPLVWAVSGNRPHALEIVKLLLENGADVNASVPDWGTALYMAVALGNSDMVKLLLDNKADLNAATSTGETPLSIAITRGELELVKLLLDNHADANKEAGAEGWTYGWTYRLAPLIWAIQFERPEIAKLLLEHQADPNALRSADSISAQEKNPPTMGVHYPFGPPNSLSGSSSPQAPWSVFPPVASETPLMFAVTERAESQNHQTVGLNFYSMTSTSGEPERKGHGPEMARLLLEHGAKANTADANGWTALIYALKVENTNAVQTLLGHGAGANILDKEGRPPLALLNSPLSETGRQIEEMLIKAGADADYNRRRGIWTHGSRGRPKAEIFQCPANSINHYTLLEFLATLYMAEPQLGMPENAFPNASYPHWIEMSSYPDFAHVSIHRLDGKRAEVLHVNVLDLTQAGDDSKDIALQPGDVVEIPEQEHKVAEKWYALPIAEITALNKCLLRTVRVVVQGRTNEIALAPSFADADGFGISRRAFRNGYPGNDTSISARPDYLDEALKAIKVETVVKSFLLNEVVHGANVLLNTSDLSRVQLTRHGVKMTFNLTEKTPADVWLEAGDVIEIPELASGAPAAQVEDSNRSSGLH